MKVILALLITLNGFALLGQQKSILIYSEQNDYFIPTIVKSIKNLHDIDSLKYPIFSSVINLNQVNTNIKFEKNLRRTTNYLSDKFYELNKNEIKELDEISQFLIEHDYLLLIKSNVIANNIEFQLFLYQINQKEGSSDKKVYSSLNSITEINSENIVINLSKTTYKMDLENSIKRLFPVFNYLPIAKISVANIEGKVATVALGDSLILKADNSYDEDTPFELLKFNWRIISDVDTKNQIDNYRLIQSGFKCNAHFFKPGNFKIGLIVFDGVGKSNEDTISIDVIPIPKFKILNKKINNWAKSSIFGKTIKNPNKMLFIIHGENDWSTKMNSDNYIESDTLLLAANYFWLRKNYEQALYDHINGIEVNESGGGWYGSSSYTYYPKKPKSIPEYEEFIKNPNSINVELSTLQFPEGRMETFEFNDTIFGNTNVNVFLEKSGLRTPKQKIKIRNKRYSPFLLGLSRQSNSWYLKDSAYENDSIKVAYNDLFLDFSFYTTVGSHTTNNFGIEKGFSTELALSVSLNRKNLELLTGEQTHIVSLPKLRYSLTGSFSSNKRFGNYFNFGIGLNPIYLRRTIFYAFAMRFEFGVNIFPNIPAKLFVGYESINLIRNKAENLTLYNISSGTSFSGDSTIKETGSGNGYFIGFRVNLPRIFDE